MNRPIEPTSNVNGPCLRMDTGIEVLESWMDSATQDAKTAVYKALFAMTGRTLLRDYHTVDDDHRLSEFFVLVDDDLVVKMRVHCFDSFGLVYIGPRTQAPGWPETDLAA